MNFLKICSVGTTNAIDMFTLGVSTARGNAEKIGQFGSGCLMATLLWMRLYGVSPIFMINGRRVEFTCVPERTSTNATFRRIYMHEDGNKTAMSVALEYGEVDWRSYEMALREFISNAIDQKADITQSMEMASEITGDPKCVEVYVPINADVQKYWHNIDQYFLHFNKKNKMIAIDKPAPSNCRVYRRGVFIRELKIVSMFDYNLDFDINESRNGSSDSMENQIYRTCSGYDREVSISETQRENILREIIKNNGSEVMEAATVYRWGIDRDVWMSAILTVVGNRKISYVSGGDNVVMPVNWYTRIVESCPDLNGMMGMSAAEMSNKLVVMPAHPTTRKIAYSLWEKLELLGMTNDKKMPDVELYKTKNGRPPHCFGLYANNTISIWEDHATSKQTILEELLHHASGSSDNTREFQEFIIRSLTEALSVI